MNDVHFAATLLNLIAAADNLAKLWRSIAYRPYLVGNSFLPSTTMNVLEARSIVFQVQPID